MSGGAIAGIIIGVILVLALVAGAFFFGRRSRRNFRKLSAEHNEVVGEYKKMPPSSGYEHPMNIPPAPPYQHLQFYDPKPPQEPQPRKLSELGDTPMGKRATRIEPVEIGGHEDIALHELDGNSAEWRDR